MATIIKEYVPAERTRSDSNGLGFLLGVILILVVAFLLVYYGAPLLRGAGGTTVNVPKSVDINVNKSAK